MLSYCSKPDGVTLTSPAPTASRPDLRISGSNRPPILMSAPNTSAMTVWYCSCVRRRSTTGPPDDWTSSFLPQLTRVSALTASAVATPYLESFNILILMAGRCGLSGLGLRRITRLMDHECRDRLYIEGDRQGRALPGLGIG